MPSGILPAKRSRGQWASLMRARGVRPTRSMGQHFLVEERIVDAIADAADVGPRDTIVEVGPGMGILTRELLVRGATVRAVELDRELVILLRDEFGAIEQFSVTEQDARFVDPPVLVGDQRYKVVANLPYSVATVIIRRFVESATPPTQLTVMVQREVAERMTAQPPEMSLLGLATQFFTDARSVCVVPPDVFLPSPKVDSAVLTLRPRSALALDDASRDRMFALATEAFQRRRKTIANGLAQGLAAPRSAIEATLRDIQIDPMRRPQTLDVEEWVRLAKVLGR